MEKPLFITYANYSLKKEPCNFYKIINKIDDEFRKKNITLKKREWDLGFDIPLPSIELILRQIVEAILHLETNQGDANRILNMKRYELESFDDSLIAYEVAYEAIFGFDNFYCIDNFDNYGVKQPNGYCISGCGEYAPPMIHIVDFDLFSYPHRIKCYECEQLFFIEILKQIINDVEYDEIPGFLTFLETVEKWSIREIVFTENKEKENPFKKNISTKYRWISPLNDYGNWKKGPNQEHPYKHIFNEYLRSFVAFSLGDFLVNEDRRKIEICKECNEFFIGRLKQKFCASKCRYKWHNKRLNRKVRKKESREKRMEDREAPRTYFY